jgi:eukaryotic-like serine/threonine-protein kinase
MSPEQLNARAVDRRSDVFSAGIVCWEALTGERLFAGSDAGEILGKVLTMDIVSPSDVPPPKPKDGQPSPEPIDERISAAVMRALERSPDERWQSARDFAIALEDVGPLATAHRVGEWVEQIAGEELRERSRRIAEIEGMPTDFARSLDEQLLQDVPIVIPIESSVPSVEAATLTEVLKPPPRRKVLMWGAVGLTALAVPVVLAQRARDSTALGSIHSATPAQTVPSVPSSQPPPYPGGSGSTAEAIGGAATNEDEPIPSPLADEKEADSPGIAGATGATPAAERASRASTRCQPPWYRDKDGIKRIKRWCLGR